MLGIRNKIRINREMEDAKKISKKNLEEYYVENENKEPESGWAAFIAIIATIVLICVSLAFYGTLDMYEGSEAENYKALGRAICEETESGNLKYFHIHENDIVLECYGNDVEILK